MLKNVSLIFLLCVFQFQCYHSRYLLIDVHGEAGGLKAPGCGDVCVAIPPITLLTCPRNCPMCLGMFVGVCVGNIKSPRINSTTNN